MLFDDKLYYHVDGIDTVKQEDFIVSKNVGKRRRETNKGWYFLIQWKYGSTTWEIVKDVK